MHAIFASYDYGNDISGVSSWLVRLLPLLRARGVDAEAHLFRIGDGGGATARALQHAGVPVKSAPWPEYSEAGTRQCLEWLGPRLPDVYVPNCIVPAYHAVRFIRPAGVPAVGVLHTDQNTSDALLAEFGAGPAERRVNAWAVVSSRLETLARQRVAPDVVVARIPCGVPAPDQQACAASGRFRIVYAGRLTEDAKRIGDVTRALIAAAERWPDVEGWIIGEGPERPNLERLVAASPARSRVRLLGRRPVDEVQHLMAQCQAYVLLSDYEGLPVSMLEAMAVGVVPIVHREAGGVAEAVTNERNGFIVGDRSEGFLRAVAALRADAARWSAMSSAARRTITEGYLVSAGADAWHDLLGQVAAARATRTAWTPPRRIALPPHNPILGWFDQRRPSFARRCWTQTRMTLGRYRSLLVRGKSPKP